MKQKMRRSCKMFIVTVLSKTPWLRKTLVHFGDFISRTSLTYISDTEMKSTGELLVQQIMLKNAPKTEKVVAFDVGANVGKWTIHLLQSSQILGRNDLEVYAFEPCNGTYQTLKKAIKSYGREDKVITVPKAMSNLTGSAVLNISKYACGGNSLYGDIDYQRTETISKVKLDDYCSENGIKHINFLKIDTEGHDMLVIEGASEMLERGAIDLIQFEYMSQWVLARRYLRDVFVFLKPFGYRIGRITPKGIEFYDSWHWRLENFKGGNYLACREQWIDCFPGIPWCYKT